MQIVEHRIEVVCAMISDSHKGILALAGLLQHSDAPYVLISVNDVLDVIHCRLMSS